MADEKEKKKKKPAKKQEKKRGKAWLWTLISVLVVLVLAVAGLGVYASGCEGILPNTYIGECNVSGMSSEEALSLLNEVYYPEKIAGGKIALSCKGNETELSLDDMKVAFDNQASVDAAIKEGSQGNLFQKTWRVAKSLFAKTVINPVLTYDKEMVEAAVTQVAGEYEVKPVDYTYEVKKNQVILYAKKDGKMVDREQLNRDLEAKICVADFSGIAVEPIAVTPEPLNFQKFYKWLTDPAEDAYYEKGDDGVVNVHPGKYQCKVDEATVRNAISAVDTATDGKVTFPVTTTAPKHTTEALTQQLYQDVLGTYSTYYSGSAARNNNVELAASRINGTELMPGDEFSYDKTILPRTYANGYQAAPVYVGNKVESGMGGVICQPSSTLYCAALYANLEILERHNHSMLVSYLPAGLDATIAEGYLDLRFKNSTKYPIKIEAITEGGKITFNILGYNPENISVELVRDGGGFYYTATRIVKKDGKEISREELDSSRYSPKEKEETPEEKKKEEEKTETPSDAPEGTNPEAGGETTAPAEPTPAPAPAPEPAPAPAPAPEPAPAPVAPVE